VAWIFATRIFETMLNNVEKQLTTLASNDTHEDIIKYTKALNSIDKMLETAQEALDGKTTYTDVALQQIKNARNCIKKNL
jgi:t-SNARE complex subunit (syntaxin)